ncbi:MAG: hypothetical protein V7632_484 [Bradyrhizobium sp.]|jgi:hypothetical protein
MTLPAAPTLAYDLTLLKTPPQRGTDHDNGWCYGLPPGIRPEQWPLSPYDGFPMQHCFTLRLPVQYRARGEAYVALAMFADQQYDEPIEVDAVAKYLAAETVERPSEGNLLPYWSYRQNRHPTECRMKDIIDHNFAAIWLTEAEFAGPLCAPPELAGNPLLQINPPPRWIERGTARTVFEAQVGRIARVEELEQKYWYRLFGHVPEVGHHAYGMRSRHARTIPTSASRRATTCCTRPSTAATSRPIRWTARRADSNGCMAATISAARCSPISGRRNTARPISRSRSISAASISAAAMASSTSRTWSSTGPAAEAFPCSSRIHETSWSGTANRQEHRASSPVVGAGNADT